MGQGGDIHHRAWPHFPLTDVHPEVSGGTEVSQPWVAGAEQQQQLSWKQFLSACLGFHFAQCSVVNGQNCAGQSVFFLHYVETNCKDKIRKDLKAVCCTGCASQPGSVGRGEVL